MQELKETKGRQKGIKNSKNGKNLGLTLKILKIIRFPKQMENETEESFIQRKLDYWEKNRKIKLKPRKKRNKDRKFDLGLLPYEY